MERPRISVVIPLFNERDNVQELYRQLSASLDGVAGGWEALLVDDGSTDGTGQRLAEIEAADPRVRVLTLRRNFGQTAAFSAGFDAARGDVVVTSDGDLQNDPADIPRLLALAARYDIVCGWRKQRHDAWLTRRVPSTVANWLLGMVSGPRIHDNGCSLKVFRTDIVKRLHLRPGMHRYLPALAVPLGNGLVEEVVNHRPRRFGRSKYGLSRTFTVLADLVQLPALKRRAIDPHAPRVAIYEIAETLEHEPQL
jgi:glycosyltransferase involved in cell wall biosynthesis